MTLQAEQRALKKARTGETAHHSGVNVLAPLKHPPTSATTVTSTIIERHVDRGSGDDDDDGRRRLPVYVRYSDLVSAGIVGSWTQLLRLIDHEQFPVGQMLSPNIRAWRLDAVENWLASRPSARKVVPARGRQSEPA